MFQVYYYWHGERHWCLQDFDSVAAANTHATLLAADGWRAGVQRTR